MKKIYQIPNIKVVNIKPKQIICASLPNGGNAVTKGIKSADARRSSFTDWDEEEY